MGHRYYTQREIDVFCHIRALKDRGFQLKAIKDVLEIMFLEEKENNIISLDNVRQGYEDNENEARKKDDVKAAETATAELAEVKKAEVPAAAGISAAEKMSHFKYIMDGICLLYTSYPRFPAVWNRSVYCRRSSAEDSR